MMTSLGAILETQATARPSFAVEVAVQRGRVEMRDKLFRFIEGQAQHILPGSEFWQGAAEMLRLLARDVLDCEVVVATKKVVEFKPLDKR